MYYHAEIIQLSQKDKKIFLQYPVESVRKRFCGLVKIYTIKISDKEKDAAAKRFQANMSRALKKEWYITIHNAEEAILVFREKIVTLTCAGITPAYQAVLDISKAEDKKGWEEAIAYAKAIGVPDSECDFLPLDYATQSYQ